MCNSLECAAYFKRERAYQRCFLELRKKWKSYGKVAGRIMLKNASEEERRAIGGIVGKTFWEEDIRFSFSEFEQGLQKTRFAPVDMKEVLDCYFGETLATNQEQRKEEEEKKRDFLDRLEVLFVRQFGQDSMALRWMKAVADTRKYGYQLLLREYGKNESQAEALAQHTGKAFRSLELQAEEGLERPLAVFAAEISGNPHYFDRGTTAGQLLIHAVCWWKERELPENAHMWREILLEAGIVPDNVSSMVHAYGLRLQVRGEYHPAYDVFCRLKEPYVLTLENLKGITGAGIAGTRAYVVENEMVFSYLVEHVADKEITILCTSGQLRTAALKLISVMIESGVRIYYSGDMDPEGLDIADRLFQKFGEAVQIWRMCPMDYEKSISGENIEAVRLSKLEHIQHPLLQETAKYMKEKKLASYQENLLDDLLGDILPG